jgi:hypothetical protein
MLNRCIHTTLAAHTEEQRHLLKTHQITARKLESEDRSKDAKAGHICSSLSAMLGVERALEARLHPGQTLASLDDLHLFGLNPTHTSSPICTTPSSRSGPSPSCNTLFFVKNKYLRNYLLNYIIMYVAFMPPHILFCDDCVLLNFIL